MKRAWLLPLLALLACKEPEEPPPTPRRAIVAAPVFSPPAGFTRLRFGLVPFLAPDTLIRVHQRLADHRSKSP